MIIDHVGIVVRSLQDGLRHWETVFGYQQHTEMVINTRQQVKVMFLRKEGSLMIKLLEPLDAKSPIYAFAKRGGGLHHLCFKCGDLEIQMDKMKELGLRTLAAPQPGEAFDNENIAFIFAKHGLNIELIDTDKKAKIIEKEDA